jgi:hypothetical protein
LHIEYILWLNIERSWGFPLIKTGVNDSSVIMSLFNFGLKNTSKRLADDEESSGGTRQRSDDDANNAEESAESEPVVGPVHEQNPANATTAVSKLKLVVHVLLLH